MNISYNVMRLILKNEILSNEEIDKIVMLAKAKLNKINQIKKTTNAAIFEALIENFTQEKVNDFFYVFENNDKKLTEFIKELYKRNIMFSFYYDAYYDACIDVKDCIHANGKTYTFSGLKYDEENDEFYKIVAKRKIVLEDPTFYNTRGNNKLFVSIK